jgi:hypothetical protein
MMPYSGQDIRKRRVGFGVPSGPLNRYLAIGMQRMAPQYHHRVEAEQTGRGALHGTVRPLALGFEAEMGPTLLEGGFNGPALDERLHNRPWPIVGAGREGGPRLQPTSGITHQYPADRHHRWTKPLPHRCPAAHVPLASSAVVPAHAHALPESLCLLEHLCQRRQALTLHTRPPVGPRPAWGSRYIQRRLHPPWCDPSHVPAGAGSCPFVDPVGLVSKTSHLNPRQPAADPQHHWARPARHGLMSQPQPSTHLGWGAGTVNTGRAHDRCVQGGLMTHVNTIHRTPLVATAHGLLDASGSRSCPRLVRRRPQRRSTVSSITHVRAPPAPQRSVLTTPAGADPMPMPTIEHG